ncbi:DUF4185 domain-containing protein [Acholeplasma hippikon]|nr:DUF4185 domain-containing protein [Acholeplasma hippikon]
MKQGDLIKKLALKQGNHTIDLDRIYPIGEIKGVTSYTLYIENKKKTDSNYANKVVVELDKETEVEIYLGLGYVALEEPTWTNQFLRSNGWSGGDGIFSFNLDTGEDCFDQEKESNTLFIFGDTFVGRSDEKSHKRLEPHLMINNSIAYYKDKKLNFKVNELSNGSITGFYHLDPKFDKVGTTAEELIRDRSQKKFGYLSGYHPKDLKLTFDFHKERTFTHLEVENYFNPDASFLYKRGFKEVEIYGSNDLKTETLIQSTTFKPNESGKEIQKLELKGQYRYLILKGISNYNDKQFEEGIFGLKKLRFYNHKQEYKDIYASASSTLLEEDEHSWIWLQDGAVVGDTLFFYPFIVNSDLNQPEGLQFRIVDITLFQTKIKNGKLDFSTTKQKKAPLLKKQGLTEYMFGAGVFANTAQANSLNPDGYIYLYGCKTTWGLRELIVSRVKAENYEFFDDYEFYSNGKWVTEISEATGLLEHVSTELSVTEIREGHLKGKYLCVFTYDVNTPEVAFSVGDSLVGPFSKPQTIYITPEQSIYKSTTYTYNAKAHPHLSKSKKVLVTYNTNTYSFDHNMSDYRVYRPRFLTLNDTERE